MTAARERLAVVAVSAVGGALAWFAGDRVWVSAGPRPDASGFPAGAATVAGHALAGGLTQIAVVAVAGAGAVFAVRGLWRVAVGLLLVAAGAGIVALALHGTTDAAFAAALRDQNVALADLRAPAWRAWPWVAVVGGALVALSGAVAVVRGRRWPALGHSYDAPSARNRPVDPVAAAWDALDRGDDPTA